MRGPFPATSTLEKTKATVVLCVPKAHGTGHGVPLAWKPSCAQAGGSASVNTVPAHPPERVLTETLGLAFTCAVWADVQPADRVISREAAIPAHRDLARPSIAPIHRPAQGGSHRARPFARLACSVGSGESTMPADISRPGIGRPLNEVRPVGVANGTTIWGYSPTASCSQSCALFVRRCVHFW